MKAQSSIEFLILSGSLLLFMMVIFYVNSTSQLRLFEFKNALEAKRTADRVENEVNIAIEQGNGYERSFLIPEKLGSSIPYKIMIRNDGSIEVIWKNHSYVRKTLTKKITNGFSSDFEISKGWNEIFNNNGIIEIKGLSS